MKKYIKGFLRYRFLLSELVKKGIKLKYRRSYLGIVWTLLEPLLSMMVLTIVFGQLLGRGDKTFPVYVLTGRLLYSCFSTTTRTAMRSIRANSGMIKKVYVPKYLYPLSGVLYNFIIFLLSLIVLAVVSVVLGVPVTANLLIVFIPLLILFLFCFGVSMILATAAVFFRDLEYLWDVLLMLIMYTCAIFYHAESIIEQGNGWVFNLNPLYSIVCNFRSCIFGTPLDIEHLLYSLFASLACVIFGTYMFYKHQDDFILKI